MAALSASEFGLVPLIIDENQTLGGQLIKQTHMFFGSKAERAGTRGFEIGLELEQEIQNRNIRIEKKASAVGYYPDGTVAVLQNEKVTPLKPKAILVATGASENFVSFPGSDLPGVYGAGAVQTLMNVYGIKPGKSVLMVGSGNIGLIVSYQLMQAGVQVKAIIEGPAEDRRISGACFQDCPGGSAHFNPSHHSQCFGKRTGQRGDHFEDR